MSDLLLCQHCGNKTSQTLIGKGQESEAIILEDGQEFDLDWFIWFVQCNNCEKYSLSRATEMVEALDTATFALVAKNENSKLIEMPLPSKNMGQVLTGLEYILSTRRLIELGALRVTDKPYVGYAWTYDGSRMIDEINKLHPGLLQLLREQ